jgi:uncharacterized lipoprotein NlpE involved in copper resistance
LTMIKQLLVLGSFAALISCGSGETREEKPLVVDSVRVDTTAVVPTQVSFEHYAGVLPCADCDGIEVELNLKSDSTWMMHIIYQNRPSKGPGSNEMSENGKWMMHGADTIHLMGRKDAPSMYIRTDSSLIQLDMKGKRIEGKLANKYVLKKL